MGTYTDIFIPGVESQDEASGAGAPLRKAVNGHASGNGRRTVNGNGRGALVSPLPPDTIAYRSSGGDSERREYAEGEGLTIEAQTLGYVLVWSAKVPPGTFLQAVQHLVDASTETELSPSRNGRPAVPFEEAVKIVSEHPDEVDFIAIEGESEGFTWEAADPSVQGVYPEVPGEVGVVFSALNRGWLEKLIRTTASPHVQADLPNILASAQRLTQSTPAASTK